MPPELTLHLLHFVINGPKMFYTCTLVCKQWADFAFEVLAAALARLAKFARNIPDLHMMPTTYIPTKPDKQWALMLPKHVRHPYIYYVLT